MNSIFSLSVVYCYLLFCFGHIWYGAGTIFHDVFAGIDNDINDQVEFGKYKKLGDTSSLREAF